MKIELNLHIFNVTFTSAGLVALFNHFLLPSLLEDNLACTCLGSDKWVAQLLICSLNPKDWKNIKRNGHLIIFQLDVRIEECLLVM